MERDQRVHEVFDKAKAKAVYLTVRAASPSIRLAQERISRATDVEFAEGFWEVYTDLRKDDYFPINEGNHTVQQNADSMAKVEKKQIKFEEYLQLPDDRKLKGFLLPLADTLNSGSHGPVIQAIYHANRQFLARHSVKPIHIARRVDVEQGKAKPNNIAFYKQLIQGFRNGYSVTVFPEGNTMGGKRVHEEIGPDGETILVPNSNNEINGMHAFEKASQKIIVTAAQKAGRKTMIIPMGIIGGTNVQDPMTKIPTRNALRVGLGFSNKKLVNVKVGLPIPTDHGELGAFIRAEDWVGANTFVERKIADLLPPNLRGIHKELVIFPGEF